MEHFDDPPVGSRAACGVQRWVESVSAWMPAGEAAMAGRARAGRRAAAERAMTVMDDRDGRLTFVCREPSGAYAER